MRNRKFFTDVLIRRFVRANRIPVVLPPKQPAEAPRLSASRRRWSGSFLKTFASARSVLATVVFLIALPGFASAREAGAIGLTVNNLALELNFFTNTLPFELVSISDVSGKEQDDLLALKNVKLRVATLNLGEERITLTEHLSKKGRSIPQDSRSFDRWFQHIAIVVSDMDKAYQHLLSNRVRHVSTFPQTLPEWNKEAGGIRAFYFRDPEDHVLEIIWFPPGKGNPKWQRPANKIFLGIDHTAIVVRDTDRSLAFYRDMLGLKVAGSAHNHGTEQEHLNQVFGARLQITALKADRGPGIELLEYISPPGGRDLPEDARANDLIFWNTHIFVDDFQKIKNALKVNGVAFVSRPSKGSRALVFRDPDGHALQLNSLPNSVVRN
jgi:catechol 2,3-dioxygenase-like lactoylglutathione lyase family enzyme